MHVLANSLLVVSIVACKLGAAEKEVPLYKHITDLIGKTNLTFLATVFTVISGGKHTRNNLAIQEIMILSIGASNFRNALQMGYETYLKDFIAEKYGPHRCNIGEDGGFAPNISSIREGLDFVKEVINRTKYNEKIKIAIDVVVTDFYKGTKYDLDFKSPNKSGQNF